MEEDKKKRNKKKKNKKATGPKESITLEAGETTSDSQIHVPETEHDDNDQDSEIIDAPNDVGIEGTNSAKLEAKYRLDREASFEEKIKELQTEKDAQIQKEAILEERIKQLLKEKDENLQNEASQKEKIKELHDEKTASVQNEANLKEKFIQLEKENDALVHRQDNLEQKIKQFEREKNAYLQKEGSLEVKILQLEGERDSWVQKEADFREKINQLVDENAALNMKTVGLLERIRHMEKERDSWILAENSAKESIASLNNDNTNLRAQNSAKESIASLNNDNTNLRAQVISLEKSRESLLEEKLQLTEKFSRLEVQINNLETAAAFPNSHMNNKLVCEDVDANSEIEAARALVKKLVAENSELVEKVNELYAELDQRSVRTEYVSSIFSGPDAVTAESTDRSAHTPDIPVGTDDSKGLAQATDSTSEARSMMPVSSGSQYLEDIMVKDHQRKGRHLNNDGSGLATSSEIIEIDEIVQIPLNEYEVEETKLEVAQSDDTNGVGLTEAPLIGAPFRLISFVARYVSGADLVDMNTGR